jgi:hypothetical protein
MTLRALVRLLVVYVAALGIACIAIRIRARGSAPDAPTTIASRWKNGVRTARAMGTDVAGDGTLVLEKVIAIGPVPSWEPLRALSFASSLDGVRAELGGKTAWLTVDDLLSRQAYDHWVFLADGAFAMGLDLDLVYALLAEPLGVAPSEVRAHARIERVRFERITPPPSAEELDKETVRSAMFRAAAYLARGVGDDGRFRYMVDAITGKSRPGYDWPRHAGATYFLAQAARLGAGREVGKAALRAANRMRDIAMTKCGEHACIGVDDPVEIGTNALGTMAFVEIVRAGLDPGYQSIALDLADFLRSQQRPDGEMMHFCTRDGHPIDQQSLYFSGEAALALVRVHALAKRSDDLDAAKRLVAYLTGPAWHFFGDRYFFGEEHWTCQAASELASLSPGGRDSSAMDFCVRWMEFNRAMQSQKGDTPFDAEGALWNGPLTSPHLTPTASRAETGVAVLSVTHDPVLELQMRRSIALLLRHQLPAKSAHLLADPAVVDGAIPESAVSWALRIDFTQHAGSAMGRWLELQPN